MKRARLADDLNEKIAQRPGPMELVEKNILPVDSTLKEAMKGVVKRFEWIDGDLRKKKKFSIQIVAIWLLVYSPFSLLILPEF